MNTRNFGLRQCEHCVNMVLADGLHADDIDDMVDFMVLQPDRSIWICPFGHETDATGEQIMIATNQRMLL